MFSSLSDVRKAISAQAVANNLAAVLIQLNDTYLIDERAGMPGLARIANLVKHIRKWVKKAVGSDRTLVLHAGDYLSPSLMSKWLRGEQMVDLLNRCQVDFATIGNHEFDVGNDVLCTRLAETQFENIAANLAPLPGPGAPKIGSFAFWPKRQPFLAITAVAGKQTCEVAEEQGWKTLDPKKALGPIIKEIHARPAISGLVVLTHMDRAEDLKIRDFVQRRWRSRGVAYLIAGHDHDIHWPEPGGGHVFLTKCLSNAKSVNVILVLRDLLGSLGWPLPRLEPHITSEEVAWRDRNDPFESARPKQPPKSRPTVRGRCRNADDIIRAYRSALPQGVSQELRASFERRVRTLHDKFYAAYSEDLIEDGLLAGTVVEVAQLQNTNEAGEGIHGILAEQLIPVIKADRSTRARIRYWQQRLAAIRPLPPDEIIASLNHPKGASGVLDASDVGLRKRSTDFGNFVADAVKQHTGADVALINSGCFRFDGELPATIRLSDLYEVFHYDSSDGLIKVALTKREILAFYKHSTRRAGQGAFLQVSDTEAQVRKLPARGIEVALIKYMLANSEDGYPPVLAKLRKVSESDVIADAKKMAGESLIEAIRKGAKVGAVVYDKTERHVARQSIAKIVKLATPWKALADQFDKLCDDAGIIYIMRLNRLSMPPSITVRSGHPFDAALDRKIAEAHGAMRAFLLSSLPDSKDTAVDDLLRYLGEERIDPDERSRYADYLKVMTGRYFPPDHGISI